MHSTAVLPSYHSTEAFSTSSPSLEIKLLKLDLASQGIYLPPSESFVGTRFGENYTSLDLNGLKTANVQADHAIISSETMTGTSPHYIKDLVSSAKLSEPTPTSRINMTPLYKTGGGSNLGTPRDYNFSNLSLGGGAEGSKDELLLKNYNLHSSQDFLGETAAKPSALKTDLESIAQIVKENLPGKSLSNSAVGVDFNKTPGSLNIAEEVKKMLEKDKSPASGKQPTEFATNFDSLKIAQIVKENLPSASAENLKKSGTPGSYLEVKKAASTEPSNIAEEVKKMLEKDKKEKLSDLANQPTRISTEFDSFLNLPSKAEESYLEVPKINSESSNIAEEVKKMLEKDKKEKLSDLANQATKISTEFDLFLNLPSKAGGGGGYLEVQKAGPSEPSNIAEEVKKMLEKDKREKLSDLIKQSEVQPVANSGSPTNHLSIAQIVKENLPSKAGGGGYLEVQKADSTEASNIAEEVKKMLEKDKREKLSDLVKQPEVQPLANFDSLANDLLIAQIVKENLKRSLTAGCLEIQNIDNSVDLKEKIPSNKSIEAIFDVKKILEEPLHLDHSLMIAQIVKENLKNNNANTEGTIEKTLSHKSTEDIFCIKKILEEPTKSETAHLDKSSMIAQIVKENLPSISSENLNNRGGSSLDVQNRDSSVDLKEKMSSNKSNEAIFDVQKKLEKETLSHHQINLEPVIAQIVKENLPSSHNEKNKSTEEALPNHDEHELMIAKIVKENLPALEIEPKENQIIEEEVQLKSEVLIDEPKKASFDPADIQNILNLDIKDLTKYLSTELEVVPDVRSENSDFGSPVLIPVNKEMLPQHNNSDGGFESSKESKIQDILNEFNPKNNVINKESTHKVESETEIRVSQQPEPVFTEGNLLGNLKSADLKASISLNFEFEYNLEKQHKISVSSLLNNLQIDDEHPSSSELSLLAQNYADARVFRGSEQTLFLALSFVFFEKLIFKDHNLLMRMTIDYPSVESIFSSPNEYLDANPSYDQFLKRLKAFLRIEDRAKDSVSFFESIFNSTNDYQNSLLLFKDVLFQIFGSSEEYFAFLSNSLAHQSFKWINSNNFEDHQIFFNLLTKILKTSIRLITFTTEKSIQENIYISPNESFITIFHDQRSEASYILSKKEETDEEIQPVSEERRGIMEDNASDTPAQVEVSELPTSDYQAEETEEEERIVQNRPVQLEVLEIPRVQEVNRVIVEETPIETGFASLVNDPQITTPEGQLSSQEELIAAEPPSYPASGSTAEEEEKEEVQNEEIHQEEVVQPIRIEIKEIDLLPKIEEEIKDELVAASSKVRDEINTILRSLSLNNSPVFFNPIESFSKEVDCSPSLRNALRTIPSYIKKSLVKIVDEVQAQDEEFMEVSNQYLHLVAAKPETTKKEKPENVISLYKAILAKKDKNQPQKSQELQE